MNSPGGRVDVDEKASPCAPWDWRRHRGISASSSSRPPPAGPSRLKDVAKIEVNYKRPLSRLHYTTHETPPIDAVGLTITKQPDANTLDTAANIRTALAQIGRTLPSGVEVTVTNDRSRYVRHAMDAVQKDLLLAILLTGIVLLSVPAHTWRKTPIVLSRSPPPWSPPSWYVLLGFSLNTVSLMALALTIGILVDDSIVVLENITRHLEPRREADGRRPQGPQRDRMAAIAITSWTWWSTCRSPSCRATSAGCSASSASPSRRRRCSRCWSPSRWTPCSPRAG